MLLTHKYSHTDIKTEDEINQEVEQIVEYVESDSILQFDDVRINDLFGNSLGINNEKEFHNWSQVVFSKTFVNLINEEKIKYQYENEKNIIKKIAMSFRYRKIFKENKLEDVYIKATRETLKNIIVSNSNSNIPVTKYQDIVGKGLIEYNKLKELITIAKMTLKSLEQTEEQSIDIVSTCRMFREEMPEMGLEFRQRGIRLDSYQCIPFAEVPNAMNILQQEYEELYNNSENQEDYIRGVAKIYGEFIDIQPYDDGNKRTSTCLLNSMLLSKGIIPPPFSLTNDARIIEALDKAQNKDFETLQDIMVEMVAKTNSSFGDSTTTETSKTVLR